MRREGDRTEEGEEDRGVALSYPSPSTGHLALMPPQPPVVDRMFMFPKMYEVLHHGVIALGRWGLWKATGSDQIKEKPCEDTVRSQPSISQEGGSYQEQNQPWLVRLSGLRTRGSPVRFPVREHAWVAGQFPSWGCTRGNHTLMFFSLSFSLPFPKNK